jgi:LacI family transcriptional regulator
VAPTPLVVVQPDHPRLISQLQDMPTDVIRSDDVTGVGQAVRHLIIRGFRHIAYLGVASHPSNRVRMTAVQAELRERVGMPLRVFEVHDEAWRTPLRVAEAIDRPLPEAIICYDDKLAIALLDGLRSLGLEVPRDVAVLGYDGIPFAAFSNPRLTTVATPAVEMGARAAEMLVEAIETGTLPPAETFPVELVVRESSARTRAVPLARHAGSLEPKA